MERSERFAKLALIPTIIAIVLYFATRGPAAEQDVSTASNGLSNPSTVTVDPAGTGTTASTPPATSTTAAPQTTIASATPTTGPTPTTRPSPTTTMAAPRTTTTGAAGTTVRPAADPSGPVVEAVGTYEGGIITLEGSVAEPGLAVGLVRAARDVVPAERVTDRLRIDPRAPADTLTVSIVRRFPFPVGAGDIEGEVALLADVAARFLQGWPEATLVLVGHTEVSGDPATDVALSRAGAQLMVERLAEHGVDPDRLRVEAEGSSQPVAGGSATNRRIEARFEGIEPG